MQGFLEGKVVVVTGAGRGIGRAVALASAAEGARVVVADNGTSVSGDRIEHDVASDVVGQIRSAGGEAVAVDADVTHMPDASRIIASGVERWGRIDGLVAAAGIVREGLLPDMAEEDWDAIVNTHLRGHFTSFRTASAVMRSQGGGGALIGFTSHAMAGRIGMSHYSAAKGGVASLVRSAAAGLSQFGITANAIAPHAATRMNSDLQMELGPPDDVAPLVVYLLSTRARHITGQVYSAGGSKIAVWNQPSEVRAMYCQGRWTPREIDLRLDDAVGVEPLDISSIRRVEELRLEAAQIRSTSVAEDAISGPEVE